MSPTDTLAEQLANRAKAARSLEIRVIDITVDTAEHLLAERADLLRRLAILEPGRPRRVVCPGVPCALRGVCP